MINKTLKLSSIFLMLSAFTIIFQKSAFAEENRVPVIIKTELPENQIDKDVEYFDLRMKPNENQKVKIKITNVTDSPLVFKLSYNNAKTTSQGNIEYADNKGLKLNIPEKFSFTEIVSGPDNLVVLPKKTSEVEISLSMPEKEFDGVIAGAVEFIEESGKADKSALTAQQSYIIGFKLSETDVKLTTLIDLEDAFVGIKNDQNAIVVPFINLNRDYVEDLSVVTEIIDESDRTVVLKSEKKMMRMAPLSTLELPIYLEDTLLDVGKYKMKVEASAQENFHKEWGQTFNVTKKDRLLMDENRQLWDESKKTTKLMEALLIALVMVIILIIGGLIIRSKYFSNKKVKGVRNGKKKKNK